MTIIDDNTVAVSTNEGVQIINIKTNTVEKSINTGMCHGLDYKNGSLICFVPGKGVLSVTLISSTITTLVQDTTNRGWFYCTVYLFQ